MSDENEDDVARGRAVLAAWQERLNALPFAGIAPGVDLRLAALGAQSTAREVEALGLIPRLRALPGELFDATSIDDTRDGALALLAASRDLAGWNPPTVTVPADLVEECVTLRRELAEVLRYTLVDDDESLKRINRIMRGAGFLDMAADLAELAEMYGSFHQALAEGGGRRYRAEDAARAARLSTRLMKLLTEPTPGTQSPLVIAYKMYALLEASHQELIDGVWFLRRKTDRTPWPTLRSLGRRPRRPQPTAPAAAPPAEPAPA